MVNFMANLVPEYRVVEDGVIKITNTTLAEEKVYLTYGADGKVDTPDPGKIEFISKGIIEEDANGKYITKKNKGVYLQLYRVNTKVLVPAATDDETPGVIYITPTLSEEVSYYKEACAQLGLGFTAQDDVDEEDLAGLAGAC